MNKSLLERILYLARAGWRACWKVYPVLFVAVWFGLLLLPLVGFSGSFTDFSKMFWGRDTLIRGYTNARLYLLKDEIFGDLFARPGPWLAYTGESSMDEYQNMQPFSDAELARIQKNLDGLDTRLREKGIHFLVVIVPGKNTIYPEYIPRQVPVLGKESRTDQVLAYQKVHGRADVLDLRPALMDARKQRQVYYATDTHWNAFGILAGYQVILRALQSDFPSLQPHTLADFDIVSRGMGSGDLSKEWVQGSVQEEMVRLEPRYPRQTVQFTLTQGTALVPGRMVATYNPNPGLPRAMIFHDSFFNEMIPFLSDHFSWAVYHWAFKVDETFVAGEKPDIVIFEVTDRYLSRLLTITGK
jgi:alginate O-acetyltransferase complex protein AlgJ